MIYLVPEKLLTKKEKKFKKYCKKKAYVIISSHDSRFGEITNVSHVAGFEAPKFSDKKKKKKDDRYYLEDDSDNTMSKKVKKKLKEFFNSTDFKTATTGAVDALVTENGELNVFIVLKNSEYKELLSRYVKKIEKLFSDYDGKPFIFTYEDIEEDDGILDKNLKSKSCDELKDNVDKMKKKIRKAEKD